MSRQGEAAKRCRAIVRWAYDYKELLRIPNDHIEFLEDNMRFVEDTLFSTDSPIKFVPRDCEEWIRENPQAYEAMIRVALDSKVDGDRPSVRKVVEIVRNSRDIKTGHIRAIFGSYFSRRLMKEHPELDFQLNEVSFLCPWEPGYEEFMASKETNLERWLLDNPKYRRPMGD